VEDCGDALCHGREKIHEAKAQSALELASTVKDNKKSFLKYINSQRRIGDNTSPLHDEVGHLTDRDTEKEEMFNAFCSAFFNTDDGPGEPQSSALGDRDRGDDKLPADLELAQDVLLQLDACELWGPRRFTPGCRETWPLSSQELSSLLFNGLGSLERSQSPGSWQMLSPFSRRVRRKTPVIPDLSVSPQCLVNYGEGYSGSY